MGAASISDAYLNQAGRFVHGYLTKDDGKVRYKIAVEDASRHKLSDPREYSGPLLQAMTAAAKGIDPRAENFSTSREEAADAWGHRDFEKAVALDPDFGAAWLAWTEMLIQQRDPAKAAEVADRALARGSLRSELDRARLDLIAATLHQDEGRRVKALGVIAKLTEDPAAMAALGDAEVNARHFKEAEAAFQDALAANPQDSRVMLSLGYAQAYAGELNTAKATLERYGKLAGQQTNSLDSLGEAYFMHGRFTDAEKYFLGAHQSNPAFLNGADLLKAAYARWLSGDQKGADEIAAKYFAAPRNDPWREASWYFSTGRREQAIAKLKDVADARLAERQLAIWNAALPNDLAALKTRYEHTPPSEDNAIRTFYAAALVKAGQKDEARKLIATWPLPGQQGGDPLAESLVFPTFLETRRVLGVVR